MPTVDINAEILHVLATHPPVSRKEIHDNLPPGTYNASYSLKDALDNISQRLNAMEKKDLVARSGKDEQGIILWSLPAAEGTKPGVPETNPPAAETPPANLTAEIMRNNPPPEAFPNTEWEERRETDDIAAEPSEKSVGDLALAELDAALATIRTTVAQAIALDTAPKIKNKAATLDALYDVTQALQKIAPTHYQLLMELGAVVLEMDEA